MVLKGSPGTVLSNFEDCIIQVRRSKQLFMHGQKQQLVSKSPRQAEKTFYSLLVSREAKK